MNEAGCIIHTPPRLSDMPFLMPSRVRDTNGTVSFIQGNQSRQ